MNRQRAQNSSASSGRDDGPDQVAPTPPAQLGMFFVSSLVAFVAHNMFSYSLVIYTRHITGSDAMTGTMFLSVFLPYGLFSPIGGYLSDRYTRKRIIVLASTLITGLIGSIALAIDGALIGPTQLPLLFAGAIVYGAVGPAMAASRIAMVGNVLPESKLAKGTIIMSVLTVVGYGAGPLVAGAIKQRVGWSTLFGCVAVAWAASALGYLLIVRYRPQKKSTDASILRALTAGARLMLGNRVLLQLAGLMVVAAIFVLGPNQTLMPQQLKQAFGLGEQARGTFMGVFGLGLLSGGIVAVLVSGSRVRGRVVSLATVAMGAALALCVSTSAANVMLTLLFACGVAGGVSNGLVSAMLQQKTPDELRGRVMSIYTLLLLGAPALGGLVFGYVAEATSLSHALLVAGCGASGLALLFVLFAGALRRE